MNNQQIAEYVAEILSGASTLFLEDIVAHGIYNTTIYVSDGETPEEHETIAAEFDRQARAMLINERT